MVRADHREARRAGRRGRGAARRLRLRADLPPRRCTGRPRRARHDAAGRVAAAGAAGRRGHARGRRPVNGLLFGPMVRCGTALPAVFLVAYSVGARCDRGRSAVGLVLCAGNVVAQCGYDPLLGPPVVVLMLPVLVAFFVAGRLVRARNEVVRSLRRTSVQLREQRERTARLAVLAERARIAGDLGDPLSARISGIADVAAAAVPALDTDPAAARRALATIERRGRDALQLMRDVLGTWPENPPSPPQPARVRRGRARDGRRRNHEAGRRAPPGRGDRSAGGPARAGRDAELGRGRGGRRRGRHRGERCAGRRAGRAVTTGVYYADTSALVRAYVSGEPHNAELRRRLLDGDVPVVTERADQGRVRQRGGGGRPGRAPATSPPAARPVRCRLPRERSGDPSRPGRRHRVPARPAAGPRAPAPRSGRDPPRGRPHRGGRAGRRRARLVGDLQTRPRQPLPTRSASPSPVRRVPRRVMLLLTLDAADPDRRVQTCRPLRRLRHA